MTAEPPHAIDIHRAAFLRLVECWRALVKPLTNLDALPEEADMCMLAAIRLCATKLAGTGADFAHFALDGARDDCERFTKPMCDWHRLSVDMLRAVLPLPDPDEQHLPCGRQRRLQPYWKEIVPLITHGTSSCRIRVLEILWACKEMNDGLTGVTYALYVNVLDKLLYVDECIALLFFRVGHRLVADGGRFFVNDGFRKQYIDGLTEADQNGPAAYANTFKYLDDAIRERLEWAYGGVGRSVAEVEQIEQCERAAKEHSRLIAMLEREAFDHDSPEARFYLADHYLRAGDYRRAAGLVYSLRNERRATEILLECFRRCQPEELDDMKWVDQTQPDTKKCLAADDDGLGNYLQGSCGVKCNAVLDSLKTSDDDFDYASADSDCDWQGRWTLCPNYRGPRCQFPQNSFWCST